MIISSPSRLHFGIVNIKNPKYPLFKCVGCAIRYPRLVAFFEESEKLILEGFERREDLLPKLRGFADEFEKKIRFKILEEIPKHVGLGSTTQICLSFAYAICEVNKQVFEPYAMAKKLGIGRISGIGIGAFLKGGFIVDTGNLSGEVPRIEFRENFPENWVFVILRSDGFGLHGKLEEEAFDKLEITKEEMITEMFSLIDSMKDAIKEKNIERFGGALTKFQRLVGLNFAKVQGGIFSSGNIERLVEFLLKNGAYGAGQSSWGPTVYGLYEKENLNLNSLKEKLATNIEIKIVSANNEGFKVFKE